MKITLEQAEMVMQGRLTERSRAIVTGASINSSEVAKGDLFFALKGQLRDGHDFVLDALGRGASAAVVARELPGPQHQQPGPLIVTDSPEQAIVRLASWVRDAEDPLIVGITGSTGKTSVKDLLAGIASRSTPTLASEKSFNNDLGVPLTLLGIKPETEVVICEMGSRGPGHIARLCRYVRPHIGILTNVGLTHFEQFGGQVEIAEAKSELVESLPEGGAAVLNADDPLVMSMAALAKSNIVTYGLAPGADIRAEDIQFNDLGQPTFRLVKQADSVTVALPASGIHQVSNALAAAAGAVCLGLSLSDCLEGLEHATISSWRMEVRVHRGVKFVNDAYNASPASVESALRTCFQMKPQQSRLIVVLGPMAELGPVSDREHRRVGELAANLASRLIVVGTQAISAADAAVGAGMQEVEFVADADSALAAIGPLNSGDVVLVKASRVTGLEKLTKMAAMALETA